MYKVTDSSILFYYKTADILDRLYMYSAYTVRPLLETEKINTSELLITQDERTLCLSECDKAISQIFQIPYKLTRTISNALLKNQEIEISNVLTPVYGIYLINKQGHNENLLPIIDASIEDLLITIVLMKWYILTRQTDLLKSEQILYPSLVVNFSKSLIELYKPKTNINTITPVIPNEVIDYNPETGTVEIPEIVVPDPHVNFKDTIQFIFSDIDTQPGQEYILELKAKYDYEITTVSLKTDTGIITLNMAINGVQIEGIVEVDATDTTNEYTAQFNNIVHIGDEVKLGIIFIQGYPQQLAGTVFITRL